MTDDISGVDVLDGPAPTLAEISITGPGISITRPVDEATMSSLIALLFGAPPLPQAQVGGGQTNGAPGPAHGPQQLKWDADLTLGEFIVETGARTFQQKICAAGYYLMNFQGTYSFSSNEVRTALADAHEDMPGNFSRDFADAASKNLIAGKQGEPGRYIIPRTGRTAVESHFQDVPKRKARKPTKKAPSKGGAE